jgi:hypothetical protein
MALKSLCGIRSEKLAEFGLKPLWGRSRKSPRSAKPDPEPEPMDRGPEIE